MTDEESTGGPPRPDDPELEEELVLAEIVSHVLDRGAVVAGEVTISVAGVDLVELGLNLYLSSTETARDARLTAFAGTRSTSGELSDAPEEDGPDRP